MARFRIIPGRSRLWAEGRSSLHPIQVQTDGLEGFVEVELADGRLDLRTPSKAQVGLDAGLLKTGRGLYDRELERRLEVSRFPRVHGELTAVEALDSGNRYHLRGNLFLHGTTHPLDGDVALRVVDERTIEITGERMLDMRDFGLDPPRFLMLRVYPEVRVRGLVVAQREN